jgi:hypothetical protein
MTADRIPVRSGRYARAGTPRRVRSREDLDWLAHSFLCHIKEIDDDIRTVQAITGFSWGFGIASGGATVEPAHALQAADWNQHLALLHEQHPGWHFLSGFHTT